LIEIVDEIGPSPKMLEAYILNLNVTAFVRFETV